MTKQNPHLVTKQFKAKDDVIYVAVFKILIEKLFAFIQSFQIQMIEIFVLCLPNGTSDYEYKLLLFIPCYFVFNAFNAPRFVQ